MLADGAPLAGIRARYLHHHIRSAAAFAQGLPEESLRHLRANRDLIEGNQAVFADEPNLILGVMSNLTYVSVQCGRYDEAMELLRSFRQLPGRWGMPETEDLDLKLFATATTLEMSLHLRMGEAGKAMELVPVVERGLRAHAHRIGPVRRAALQYLVAYALLASGSAEQALRRCNDLLNGLRHDDAGDAARHGRLLLLLLIMAQSGKRDVLPYAVRNTERFLKQHGEVRPFEARLFQLMRELARAGREAQRKAVLAAFRDDAARMVDDPAGRAVLDHMDPVAWAEGLISGRAMAEVLKERAARMARGA